MKTAKTKRRLPSRDELALIAMQGLASSRGGRTHPAEERLRDEVAVGIANDAYAIADAMMKIGATHSSRSSQP
jgi:hypothetical protein